MQLAAVSVVSFHWRRWVSGHLESIRLIRLTVRTGVCPQEFCVRWRAAQARMLSALYLGDYGLRTLQPIQKRPLPPPDFPTAKKRRDEAHTATKECYALSPSGSRDTLSAEESRGQSLTHLWRHLSDGRSASPDLSSTRWARIGGRGRLMAMSDTHRGWGRGWGSAMQSRRAVGPWGSLDWGVRSGMEEDEDTRDGGRRRLLRSDLSQRIPARGRRATSVESRLDSRRSMTRVFHARMRGFTEPRDEETGALLVEFNDGTDEMAADVHGVEGGSAGSAETVDTSQDGDEEVCMQFPSAQEMQQLPALLQLISRQPAWKYYCWRSSAAVC